MSISTVVTGMVLSAMPIGEYDKRIVLLTKEIGKISAFARGARKPSSALLACTQPFTFGKYNLYVGRESHNIISAEVDNYFSEIRNDLNAVYYGMYFCEFSDYYTREGNNEKEILKLLYVSLNALIKKHIENELIRLIFELRMIAINGQAPHVFSCLKCNSEDDLNCYSLNGDGLLCDQCRTNDKLCKKLMPTTIYTMRYIINANMSHLYSFNITEIVFQELEFLLTGHKRKYIDYNFKSLEMLNIIK